MRTDLKTMTAVGLLAVGSAACSSDDGTPVTAPPDADAVVSVDDHDFDPAITEIVAGDSVAWLFEDSTRHDVSFEDGPASPIQKSGTWSRTFDEPGRHDYVCTLHDDMTGTVVVSDAVPEP